MNTMKLASLAVGALLLASVPEVTAQHAHHGSDSTHTDTTKAVPAAHPVHLGTQPAAHGGGQMFMAQLGGGWSLMGMAQLFPIGTWGAPFDDGSPVNVSDFYLTQPAAMINLESPGSRLVLRTTLNFEGETQREGEYTFGGWGEGYLDKRHPHTFLHELMLSWNVWAAPDGALSISAGKGFAPYGTDDPMSRPVVKYPTNHHLSQILERWTLNGIYLHRSGLSLEAGLFGGAEPESPSDLSNIESFGDSWSARVAQRFGGNGTGAPWEVSASYGHVAESHHGSKEVTELYNAAVRRVGSYDFGRIYGLGEISKSEPETGEGFWSLLGEARLEWGRHRPYYRAEFSTRPEYPRQGPPGSDEFYRYDHGAHAVGASRWQIHTMGYEIEARTRRLIARPFVEAQYNRVSHERGDFDPIVNFGNDRFWSVSAGFKIFLGGDAMRMGSYGVLDPMSETMHGASGEGNGHAGRH